MLLHVSLSPRGRGRGEGELPVNTSGDWYNTTDRTFGSYRPLEFPSEASSYEV